MTRVSSLALVAVLSLLPIHGARAQQPDRFYAQTGFSVGNDRLWEYFAGRGGANTFGYPISDEFVLLGLTTQVFQRHVLQVGDDGSVHPANLLDPELLPISTLNFVSLPAHDPEVAAAAPGPSTPNYGQAVLDHLTSVVPDEWKGQPVNFRSTYLAAAPGESGQRAALSALEVWGFPTSRPERDPENENFVYQRFQRGILHFDASSGSTGALLMGTAFAATLRGDATPADLAAQMAGSPFWAQYDPASPGGVARPAQLPGTNLASAFVKAPPAAALADDPNASARASEGTSFDSGPGSPSPSISVTSTSDGASSGSSSSPTPVIPISATTVVPSSSNAATLTPTSLVIVISLPADSSSSGETPQAFSTHAPQPTPITQPSPTPFPTSTPRPSPTPFPTSTPRPSPTPFFTATPQPPTATPAAPGAVINSGQTVSGTISGGPVVYYFSAVPGKTATVRMVHTSAQLDPYLRLYSPNNVLVRFDDDSAGDLNAQLSYSMIQTGWYRIEADRATEDSGGFALTLTIG